MPKVVNEETTFAATVKIFVKSGYEHTTLGDIAKEANIHEATLYRKYGTKANLIELAITHQLSDASLDKLIYSGNLKADLKMIVQAYMNTHTAHGEILLTLLSHVPSYPEIKNTMGKPLAYIARIINIIEQYQKQGLLKEEPPIFTVGSLLGPIIVKQMFERALEEHLPIPYIDPEEYVNSFLHGKGI